MREDTLANNELLGSDASPSLTSKSYLTTRSRSRFTSGAIFSRCQQRSSEKVLPSKSSTSQIGVSTSSSSDPARKDAHTGFAQKSSTAHAPVQQHPSDRREFFLFIIGISWLRNDESPQFTIRIGLPHLVCNLTQDFPSPNALKLLISTCVFGLFDTPSTTDNSLTQLLQKLTQICKCNKNIVHLKQACSVLDTERYLVLNRESIKCNFSCSQTDQQRDTKKC